MAHRFTTGIDLQGQRAQNAAQGTSPSDLVTLAQIQNLINGVSWHAAAYCASAGSNISITSAPATIDGVTPGTSGPTSRVLLKDQTTASQNGIYIYNGSGNAMTRAADGVQGELAGGAGVYVEAGTVNADTAWTLTTDDPITIGTTNLTFAKFGAGIAYTAGLGLLLAGTVFSIDTTKVVQKYGTTIGDGATLAYTITHNLNNAYVQVQAILISTGEVLEADISARTANGFTLTFGSAPASNTVYVAVAG